MGCVTTAMGCEARTGVRRHGALLSPTMRATTGACRRARRRVHAVDQTLNPLVASLNESKTMQLSDKATELREAGVDVIGLAAGQPDFATPPAICAAGTAAIDSGLTTYTPNTGTSALRAAISAKLLSDNGLTYSPSDIVVTNGAKQAIWQAVLSCVSPGDEVVIPAPYWVSYPEMAKLAGATPVVLPTSLQQGFKISPAHLEAALTPQSRLLILCTPSNPSGMMYSPAELEALAEVVAAHPRLLVVSDEIYELIAYAPNEHRSFAALPGMWERTVTINGVSKAFAMTGWRIGYAAAPPHFARAMAKIQSQSTSGACSISQAAATAALTSGCGGGEAVRAMVDEFQARRDFVVASMRSMGGLQVLEPEGAFYVLPDASAYIGPERRAPGFGVIDSADTLCRFFLEEAHVAVVPGEAFGAPGCFRLSYAASQDQLRIAMERLEQALGKISR